MPDPSLPKRSTPPPLAESLPESEPEPTPRPAPRPQARPGAIPGPAGPAKVEAEQRIREANLLRMRGQVAAAERELMRAIELSPGDAQAFEMLGDVQRQAGRAADALKSYTRASELPAAPGTRASLESKMARMALESNRGAVGAIGNAALLSGNAAIPVVSSAVMPGVGQMISGRTILGVIIFLAWVTSLILIFELPASRNAIADVMNQIRGGPPPSVGAGAILLLVLCLINVGTWLYSVVDAWISARRP